MALAGCQHVRAPVESQFHRILRVIGTESGEGPDDGCLALLAPEAATHPPHLDLNPVRRPAQELSDARLRFARMLGGKPYHHAAVILRERQRGLRLKVEMILAADAQRALQTVLSCEHVVQAVSPLHDLGIAYVETSAMGLYGVEHCRQGFDFRLHQAGARLRGLQAVSQNQRQWLAYELYPVLGESRLCYNDRSDFVGAGNISGRECGEHARDCEGGLRVDAPDFAMRRFRQDQRSMQESGRFPQVVNEARFSRGMDQAAVVGEGLPGVGRAGRPDCFHRLHHRSATCRRLSPCRSNSNRRRRPAAARMRYFALPRMSLMG